MKIEVTKEKKGVSQQEKERACGSGKKKVVYDTPKAQIKRVVSQEDFIREK